MSELVPEIVRIPPGYLPNPLIPQSYDEFRGTDTPLVIDNGSTNLRFGFATSAQPFSATNVVAKFRERKSNKPLLLFGDAIDVESGARSQARTPWEGDVLLNFDALENALDYAFIHLGIDTPSIEHPLIMTERLCSPLHSRSLTSELVFELYSAPSLTYCVDSIMSFYHNNLPPASSPFTSDGIAVSFNAASTSVIPILNGKGLMSHAKRIPWGATQANEYLLKLIQLKYPTFPTRVTTAHTGWLLQNKCEFATDYTELIRSMKDPLNLKSREIIVQFPFAAPTTEEKTEEELARIAERRREQGKKLQEIAAKARLEKLMQKETDLQSLTNLREKRDEENKKEWAMTLKSEGFDSDAALDAAIKKLEVDLRKSRKKDAEGDDMEEEPPSFPLVDVPDADEQLKEKKRQKLMKAGWEARERARREKEREREEREAEEKREEDERSQDLQGWAAKLRKEHDTLINKIKDRARRKAALTDRKSAAAQARMKNIANLAADERVPKKRRKNGGEDTFGADDADWAIYRKIASELTSLKSNTVDSSDEEEDLLNLQTVEQKLLTHDPSFTEEHTHASLTSQRSALLSAFRPQYDEGDVEGKSRIHLNIERWRVCEAWFSPSMAGVDSAGLGEVLQTILSRFSDAEKGRLVKRVFVTGGPSQLPGLVPRLHASLRPILSPDMPLKITKAADPFLDAWKGMADFAQTEEFRTVGVTKAEYEEWGGERIKRWWGGNWNWTVPAGSA
ncbi:actin-like protein Arp5p [Irpex rosettiformis]|uniref:Actin-like protein Arp5p n=1 Tax=Irpex rosettiformis TaxID=378272 RepID=A0ACB8U6T7_9APHY|nr:actin-like protein Arp5p [Irpex rosettiformis]